MEECEICKRKGHLFEWVYFEGHSIFVCESCHELLQQLRKPVKNFKTLVKYRNPLKSI